MKETSIKALSSALAILCLTEAVFLSVNYNKVDIDFELGEKIDSIRFSYNSKGKFWGENLFRRQYGTTVCEANTITSVSSRIFTNFLDLEVYCRDTIQRFTPTRTLLPKPGTPLISAYIQNYNDFLYSVTSDEIYDFSTEQWVSTGFGVRKLFYLQPYQDGWAQIKWGQGDCKTLSISVDEKTTYCLRVKSVSAVLVWDGRIYINDEGDLAVYDFPDSITESSNNIYLTETSRSRGSDWSYFIVPALDGRILWGGSKGGYGEDPSHCPPIRRKGQWLDELFDPKCILGEIKEWYAITRVRDEYYLGNYPDGVLRVIDEVKGELNPTEFGKLQKDDYQDNVSKTRYRESQSVTYSYGYLWIGMYPWGELIQSDLLGHFNEARIRLFSSPTKGRKVPAPYFSNYIEHFGDSYHRDWNAEHVYSFVDADGKSLRSKGLEPTVLGQRIPSITVLNGRICASTGNLNQLKPSDSVLSKLNVQNIDEYGKIHCLLVPNQTLIKSASASDYDIVIFERGFKIFADGKLVKHIVFPSLEIEIEKPPSFFRQSARLSQYD